ncbi:kinase [Bacillus cereus group sp. Sample62]|nr:kinase [Bacillus cereus]HDX9550098.1 kinase [Bacillus thuringiensis]
MGEYILSNPILKSTLIILRGNSAYFDLSLKETIRRHNTRDQRHEFGEDSLEKWYNPHDTIEVPREAVFTDNFTQKDIFDTILTDVAIQK